MKNQARQEDCELHDLAPPIEIRDAHAWASSPLGPPDTWPTGIQTIFNFVMDSPYPMHLAWGPELRTVYNAPYALLLGQRHPSAMGEPLLRIWPDCAEGLLPLTRSVLAGEVVFLENKSLCIEPPGGRRMCRLTCSHIPLRDSTGASFGIWSTVCKTMPLARKALRLCLERQCDDALWRQSRAHETLPFLPAADQRFPLLRTDSRLKVEASTPRNGQADSRAIGQAFAKSSVMLAIVGCHTREFEFANAAYADMVGASDLVGRRFDEVLTASQAAALAQALAEVCRTGGASCRRESLIQPAVGKDASATEKNIDFEFFPIRGANEIFSACAIIGQDATAEVVAIKEARIARERWQVAIEAHGSGTWECDLDSDNMILSQQWLHVLGYAKGEFEPTFDNFQAHLHPQDRPRVVRAIKGCMTGATARIEIEYRMLNRNGHYQWAESRGMVTTRDLHGRPLKLSGILSDISNRKVIAETYWAEANFDALTGLPNRRLFNNRLDNAMLKAGRSGEILALMFIDLDGFKYANDAFGHDVGDAILKEAAARLGRCVRRCDTVARLGGDEFTILLTDLQQHTHVEDTAQKLIDAIGLPFDVNGKVIHLSASVGIALCSDKTSSSTDLISHADHAMYQAKSAGGNQFCYFTQELQQVAQHRMRICADLKNALRNHEFQLVFEPIFNLETMQIVRANALLRWNHPHLGILAPADFLALVTDIDCIDLIDNWVLCRAAELATRLAKHTNTVFPIDVKKSFPCGRTLAGPGGWLDLVRKLALAPGTLGIEVNERFLQDTRPATRSLLDTYRHEGMELVLDNFGAGSFSVVHVHTQKFASLKMDLQMISRMIDADCHEVVVKSIMQMAHCLDMRVVVAGIETQHQKDFLGKIGCHYGQGSLLSQPLSETALLARLAPH